MTISIDTLIGVMVGVITVELAWMFAIHGRLSAHERGCEERHKALDERHTVLDERCANMERDLRMIRELLQQRGRVA